jgi:hypothetical protein
MQILVVVNTYVANQAAFLTANILRGKISSVEDLKRAKAPVLTPPVYKKRLLVSLNIEAESALSTYHNV